MNLKLVVTDMDGTFLNNEGTFDMESFHLLKNQMTEKDIKFVFCTGKQCERVEALIGEHTNDVYIIASEDSWIDITKQGINKGTTINKIQEHLGIEISETIAFGDGLNDIDLFKAAKYKVAMDNAYPELKAQANLIAKNNDESGVIKTLQLLIND
ncbi:hypothetical protein BUZ08_06120 [Staphylococcus gallinarum]|uniref:HAD-IIB family hydrolase n=1 Tax=Staphylococcus gallinarum TaxID=1293 RepID=UPI000D1FA6DC|nr:HAD-IIB family hydrolase [Staphylococcus gallinarum]PTL17425.1 hypothetical protein BUZ08_06120 [Staphylococcus gallinarum]RIO79066.1 HAD-IIB family hydrolase [Staphylococcus gallinarum]